MARPPAPDQLWSKGLPLDEMLHRFTVGEDPVTDLSLLPYDAEASAAHARMLGETGLLPEAEARALVAQLKLLKEKALKGQIVILPEQEDGHTALEAALTEALGETGKRVHLGRSRNDQVITALRLLMRDQLLALAESAVTLAQTFLNLAAKHEHAPLPGYTHLRRAMPSTWGQWGAAYAEGLIEELEALPGLWQRLDKCPLGAAAGFGVPLPLNRARTAELLAFSRVQTSPIDVMNSRGRHELAILSWLTSAAGTLEKALWDLSLYSTEEFGFVKLPDAFTTGSSIMPQKRNPDVVELARARCRELRGLAQLVSQLAGGLPSSYHRDHQFLKKPYLEALVKGRELLDICAHLLPGIHIQEEACRNACTDDLYAAQEAYRLVAEQGLPFRDAYKSIAAQIQEGRFKPDRSAPAKAHIGSMSAMGLEDTAAALCECEAWIQGRRDHLANATEKLFDWK
jgi:argininosuccinate lyase